MTVFSGVVDKTECESCEWQTTAPSRRKAIERAREHYIERGHGSFDFGHRLRFEGEGER